MLALKCMVLVLVAIAVCPTTMGLALMGKCTHTPATDASMDFDQFANVNNGIWQVSRVVNSTFNSKLKSLSYDVSPTSKAGVYKLHMDYKSKDGTSGVFADEQMSGFNKGFILSSGTASGKAYTLKLYFLKYEPSKLAVYYICSDDGEDLANDYRYVLAQEGLTSEQEKEIKALETANGFKGALISL